MKTPKRHLTYVWTLITIILSVAIIFVSNMIPLSFLSISALPENISNSVKLNLPDTSEIISSPAGDNTENLRYFPDYGSNLSPSAEYNIEKVLSEDHISEKYDFSLLLETALVYLFGINAQAKLISEKCTAWNVYSKSSLELVDTVISVNIILFDYNNTLWIITAYGDSGKINYLERTLYFSSDYSSVSEGENFDDRKILKSGEDIVYDLMYYSYLFGVLFKGNDKTDGLFSHNVTYSSRSEYLYIYKVEFPNSGFKFNVSINGLTNNIEKIERIT